MGHRLSKIYTRTGDAGTTGLGDGSRVARDMAPRHSCATSILDGNGSMVSSETAASFSPAWHLGRT